MSDQEARARLGAYRALREDRSDPYFAEALRQVSEQPELALWCEEQRALDAVLANKLSELSVPASLEHELCGADNQEL